MRPTIDPKVWDNAKLRDAGLEAAALYLFGLAYCADKLTDGFVPGSILRYLAAGAKRPDSLAKRLVDRGLWVRVDGGWEVHDWEDWNPSADAERERLARARERMRRKRGNGGSSRERASERSRERASEQPRGRSREHTGERSGERSGERASERSRLARADRGLALGLLSETPGFTNPRLELATDALASTGVAEPESLRTAKPQFVRGMTSDQRYNLGRISDAASRFGIVSESHVEYLRFLYGDPAVTEALTRLRDVDCRLVLHPIRYLDSVVERIAFEFDTGPETECES